MKKVLISLFALMLFAGFTGTAKAASVTVDVRATAGPWLTIRNYDYSYGVNDYSAPVIINSSSGIWFNPGNTISIEYLSGLTSAFGGTPTVDADGHTNYITNGNNGSSGYPFPSKYIDSGDYPTYLNELMGTFANSQGYIVGTPFAIGASPLDVIVPNGATQLQLGLNDDIFRDNTGSLQVLVSGLDIPPASDPAPEPASTILGLISMAGLYGARKRKEA